MQLPFSRPVRLAFCTLLLSASVAFGQSADSTFYPLHPIVMAQGGSQTAVARGYSSLFTNPAGFARSGSELTLLSTTMWVHSNPFTVPASTRALFAGDLSANRARVEEQFTNGGFGFGGSTGLGYVGNGVGIGASVSFDSLFSGSSFPTSDNAGDVTGVLLSEISLVGGLALPFDLGRARASVGANIRPFARMWAAVDDPAIAAGMIARYLGVDAGGEGDDFRQEQLVLNGFGLAFDAGALLEWDQASFGFSVRDIGGTDLGYSRHTLDRVWTSLQNGGLPAPARPGDREFVEENYRIPTTVNVGGAWHPSLTGIGRRLNPVFHAEVRDLFRIGSHDHSLGALLHLHVGAEATLWNTFAFRAGLYQGHPTVGGGLMLGFFHLNAAWFAREMGDFPGDAPARGAALEAAFRF